MLPGVETVQFGITDLCDMACVMCPQTDHLGLYGAPGETGSPLPGARGFMDFELFCRTLDDCRRECFHLGIVSLIWLGESLLHPRFADFVRATFRFAEETGLADAVVFNTNAQTLDRERTREILDAATRADRTRLTVTFSLDGWHPETVRRLKPGADPERIRGQVIDFLEEFARRRESIRPPATVLLQMIVLEENAAEAEAFRDGWAEIGRQLDLPFDLGISAYGECPGNAPLRIVFKRASVKYQEPLSQLHRRVAERLGLVRAEDDLLFRLNQQEAGARRRFREACSAPFETLVVHWDGRVTPCCADSGLDLEIGDLRQNCLPEIARGPQANALREAQLSGDLSAYPRCLSCHGAVRPARENEEFLRRVAPLVSATSLEQYRRRRAGSGEADSD